MGELIGNLDLGSEDQKRVPVRVWGGGSTGVHSSRGTGLGRGSTFTPEGRGQGLIPMGEGQAPKGGLDEADPWGTWSRFSTGEAFSPRGMKGGTSAGEAPGASPFRRRCDPGRGVVLDVTYRRR